MTCELPDAIKELCALTKDVNLSTVTESRKWKAGDIKNYSVCLPDFYENTEQQTEPPKPTQDKALYWSHDMWSLVVSYVQNDQFIWQQSEVDYFNALWCHDNCKGAPAFSPFVTQAQVRYVGPLEKPTPGEHSVSGRSLTMAESSNLGYVSWGLLIRFAQKEPGADQRFDNRVFDRMAEFFPNLQDRETIIAIVSKLVIKLRGFFKSGTPFCQSGVISRYGMTLSGVAEKRYAWQVGKNADIPQYDLGWFSIMSVGLFLYGCSAYNMVLAGVSVWGKNLSDLVIYLNWSPFAEFYKAVSAFNKELTDDKWYGVARLLDAQVLTPLSLKSYSIPGYVGLCLQAISKHEETTPDVQGLTISARARGYYWDIANQIVNDWDMPPDDDRIMYRPVNKGGKITYIPVPAPKVTAVPGELPEDRQLPLKRYIEDQAERVRAILPPIDPVLPGSGDRLPTPEGPQGFFQVQPNTPERDLGGDQEDQEDPDGGDSGTDAPPASAVPSRL